MPGIFGLGGIGGIGGAQPPKGLLGQYYDPAEMRRQQLKQGLLQAGIGMLQNGKGSFGEVLGNSLAGGLQGANQAGQNYRENALGYQQLAQQQAEQKEKERNKAAVMQWLDGLPEDQQELARVNPQMAAEAYMKQRFAGGGGTEFGLNPIWGTGPDGKPMLFQTNKSGGAPARVQFPEGFTPQPGVQYLDTGLGYLPANKRTGQPEPGAAPIPKNVAGEAAQKEIGKQTGEAAALHSSLSSKLPGLKMVVTELEKIADEATYTKAGQAYNFARKELGMEPTDAAVARAKYIAMVDNQVLPMLRDTFGAQFTVVEGESLRSTLGDANKTPEEKKAVLNAFIEQKIRNIEAAAVQGNVNPAQATTQNQAPGAPQNQGFPGLENMSDEELEAIVNGQ